MRQDDKIKVEDWPIFVLMDHREIFFQGKRAMTEYLPRTGSEQLPGGELLFFPGSCCVFAVTQNKSPACNVASSNY